MSPSNLPEFGHPMRKEFCIDPNFINLNCGSFGCLPWAVHNEYNRTFLELEANPDRFIRGSLRDEQTQIRKILADFVRAEPDSCVTVPNVAHGINVVLRSFPWKTGDVLIMPSTTYSVIARSVNVLRELEVHPDIKKFELVFPTSHEDILTNFRQCIRDSKSQHGTTMVLFDTIISTPGVLMPWRKMVQICKDEGVWSLVDAAHSIGHELDINLAQVSPDFWVTSCSKWLYAKRGCTLLYVAPRNQSIIKHDLIPSMLKPGLDYDSFQSEFYWSGSQDVMTLMTVKPALEFRESLGGEQRIVDYCHKVAVEGGHRLAEILGTEMLCSTGQDPFELIGCVVNVALPFPQNVSSLSQAVYKLDETLLKSEVYANPFVHNGRGWIRVSVQIFNQIEDFEVLGSKLLHLCAELA